MKHTNSKLNIPPLDVGLEEVKRKTKDWLVREVVDHLEISSQGLAKSLSALVLLNQLIS